MRRGSPPLRRAEAQAARPPCPACDCPSRPGPDLDYHIDGKHTNIQLNMIEKALLLKLVYTTFPLFLDWKPKTSYFSRLTPRASTDTLMVGQTSPSSQPHPVTEVLGEWLQTGRSGWPAIQEIYNSNNFITLITHTQKPGSNCMIEMNGVKANGRNVYLKC